MEKVNVNETKTHLSALLKRIEQGEKFLITRGGRPVAQLIPVILPRRKRIPSFAAFRAKISRTKTSPLTVLDLLRKEAR